MLEVLFFFIFRCKLTRNKLIVSPYGPNLHMPTCSHTSATCDQLCNAHFQFLSFFPRRRWKRSKKIMRQWRKEAFTMKNSAGLLLNACGGVWGQGLERKKSGSATHVNGWKKIIVRSCNNERMPTERWNATWSACENVSTFLLNSSPPISTHDRPLKLFRAVLSLYQQIQKLTTWFLVHFFASLNDTHYNDSPLSEYFQLLSFLSVIQWH